MVVDDGDSVPVDLVGMAGHVGLEGVGLEVPELDGGVLAARDQHAAVAAPAHLVHRPHVSPQRALEPARAYIQSAETLITDGMGSALHSYHSGWMDGIGWVYEQWYVLSSYSIPDLKRLVEGRRRQQSTIRAETHCRKRLAESTQKIDRGT